MSGQHLSVNEACLTFPFAVGASHFGHGGDESKIRVCLFQALENIQKGCVFWSPIGIEEVQLVRQTIMIHLANDAQERRNPIPPARKTAGLFAFLWSVKEPLAEAMLISVPIGAVCNDRLNAVSRIRVANVS